MERPVTPLPPSLWSLRWGPKTYSCHASPVIGCLLSFNSNFEDKKSAGLCLIIVLWMMMMMTICIYKENYSLQNFQLMYGYYSLINVERK